MLGRPNVGFVGCALAARREQRVQFGDILGLHEELQKGLMCRVGRRRSEHQFRIGGDLDLPVPMTGVRDRQTPYFGVILGRYDYLQRRRDRGVGANEFRAILGKGDLIGFRLDSDRLITRRPEGLALNVSQEDVTTRVVACGVFPPACHPDVAPAAVAGTGAREHYGVAPIREQMRLRHGIVWAQQTADLREPGVRERRGRIDLLCPRMNCRHIAWRALLQQQFRRLNAGLGMKSSAHLAIEKDVRNGHDGHALMMRHVRLHDGDLGTFRKPRAGVVERLIESVSAACADGGKALEIAHGALRIDHGRQTPWRTARRRCSRANRASTPGRVHRSLNTGR